MLPSITLVMSMPDIVDPGVGSQALARLMTEAGKGQLDIEIQKHHRRDVPRHFRQGNRGRYQHFQRSHITKIIKDKVWHSRTDLVKSTMTRDTIVAGWKRKQIGGQVKFNKGAGMSGGLSATLWFRFPFKTNFRGIRNDDAMRPSAVTPIKMALEIESWTEDEIQKTADGFRRGYIQKVKQGLTRRRVSKKIRAQLKV